MNLTCLAVLLARLRQAAAFTLLFCSLAHSVVAYSSSKLQTINYSPFRDGQRPGGRNPSEDQIREDLRLLKQITDEIRVYGIGSQTHTILRLCQEEGLKIHLSAWLSKDKDPSRWSRENFDQVNSLVEIAKDWRYRQTIKSLIVGSEPLYRKDMTQARLLQYIHYVKSNVSHTGIPVTSGIIFFNLNHELVNAVDYVLFHIHPLWEGRTVEESARRVINIWDLMKQRYPHKAIHIGETGWATNGHHIDQSIPSAENQLYFLSDLIDRVTTHPRKDEIKIFIFSAFDEAWKGSREEEGSVGAYWGLFNSDRTPKLALRTLFDL